MNKPAASAILFALAIEACAPPSAIVPKTPMTETAKPLKAEADIPEKAEILAEKQQQLKEIKDQDEAIFQEIMSFGNQISSASIEAFAHCVKKNEKCSNKNYVDRVTTTAEVRKRCEEVPMNDRSKCIEDAMIKSGKIDELIRLGKAYNACQTIIVKECTPKRKNAMVIMNGQSPLFDAEKKKHDVIQDKERARLAGEKTEHDDLVCQGIADRLTKKEKDATNDAFNENPGEPLYLQALQAETRWYTAYGDCNDKLVAEGKANPAIAQLLQSITGYFAAATNSDAREVCYSLDMSFYDARTQRDMHQAAYVVHPTTAGRILYLTDQDTANKRLDLCIISRGGTP